MKVYITLFIFSIITLGFTKDSKEIELPTTLPTEVTIQNGKVKVLRLDLLLENLDYSIICDKLKVPYRVVDKKLEVILWSGYYSPDRNYDCELELKGKKQKLFKVKVEQYAYKETHLSVQPGKVVLTAKNQKRVAKEQKILNAIYSQRTPNLLFSESFILPLNSERTSIYGDKRIFNKKHPSTHLGNDFRAPIGTQIAAANLGKVVFVGDLFYSGHTVIIDHGMQVFSMYAHLSKTQSTTGNIVQKGEIIGLSGATGRVSGPHLHWGIKINGEWVDGFSLVEEYNSLIANDKKENITKI